MTTYVLVPGAWLGGWVWQRILPGLQGHRVVTPTLSGLADDGKSPASVDLATHINDVASVIATESAPQVVLLGHSYAGMVITGVAAAIPDRIGRLVFLDAALPTPGRELVHEWSDAGQAAVKAEAVAGGDPSRWPLPADLDRMSDMTDFSPQDLAWLKANATSHPLATLFQPIDYSPNAIATIEKVYVHCTTDGETPPGVLNRIESESNWTLQRLESGHWPMITQPDALARLLISLA